ncbi:MAG: hypothetical protein GTN76_04535, partial [Candidatus Aenigmarchaeota archaeon]|nr:hypothetical protein [Candidatus Aenigmarchaeota archaeon]
VQAIAVIRNDGNASVDGVEVYFIERAPGYDDLIDPYFIDYIEAGERRIIKGSARLINVSVKYLVIVRVDPNNLIEEYDEYNNDLNMKGEVIECEQ